MIIYVTPIWRLGFVLTVLSGLLPSVFGCIENDKDLITVPAADKSHTEKSAKGKTLVDAVRTACHSVGTGKCSVTLNAETRFAGDDLPLKQSRIGTIWFRSPGSLRFEGTDSNGYRIVVIFHNARLKEVREVGPTNGSKDLVKALDKYSGVTLHCSTLLPSLVTEVKWEGGMFLPKGDLLQALATGAELEDYQTIQGKRCARVVCQRDVMTRELFIDNETNLIKRIITSSDEKQMARQRELGGGGRSGTIEGRHYVYDLEWTKEEVPDKVFEDPDFLLPQRKKPK